MLKNLIKGWLGEFQTNLGQWLLLNKNVYHSVNNITIESQNGTTQIDHVIVSIYGIFVIETKNFGGWIFGNESDKNWTQVLYGKKSKFQNPLHQNYRHIKCLSEFLNLEEDKFHSVIVFWGDAKFKTQMPKNVLDGGHPFYIKSKKAELINVEDVPQIITDLKDGRLPKGFATRTKHLESLEKRHNSDSNCPKCNSSLVERTVRKGKRAGQMFLGCSSYPKCRYMKNIEH